MEALDRIGDPPKTNLVNLEPWPGFLRRLICQSFVRGRNGASLPLSPASHFSSLQETLLSSDFAIEGKPSIAIKENKKERRGERHLHPIYRVLSH